MEEQFLASAKQFRGNNLLTAASQLLANPDVQHEIQSISEKEDEWLPPLLEAFSLDDEDIMLEAIYQGGDTCAPEVKNIVDIYRMSNVTEIDDVERTLECPFREVDGLFYYSDDYELQNPINNAWEVTECGLWVYPLPPEKRSEYQLLAPLSKIVSTWWAGISSVQLGDLLPPYHPVLIFRLVGIHGLVFWMMYECGNKGISFLTTYKVGHDHTPPLQDLLGEENGSHAQRLRHFTEIKYKHFWHRPLTVYDFLYYGLENSAPISLKWHLNKYKDDVIKGVTSYCSTTCWGFVNGALDLFTDFQLTPEILRQEANFRPPNALNLCP
eukprot:Phypoly_transcript_11548.p1 GENE.Phypoly_transcript_11548~~Phypoly_transcript_11548.p1  ORF type:complete len:326 (+),score=32.71 Phypoly_transcript_11548:175-1152(+)